jgi:hypothetical protein
VRRREWILRRREWIYWCRLVPSQKADDTLMVRLHRPSITSYQAVRWRPPESAGRALGMARRLGSAAASAPPKKGTPVRPSSRSWSGCDLVEFGFGGLQIRAFGELHALVEDLLDGDDCRSVEAGYACREPVDERVHLGDWECSVDPAVALGRVGVEVLAAEDDLGQPPGGGACRTGGPSAMGAQLPRRRWPEVTSPRLLTVTLTDSQTPRLRRTASSRARSSSESSEARPE